MDCFQNTSIYQESLKLLQKTRSFTGMEKSPILHEKILHTAIDLTSFIIIGLEKEDIEEGQKDFLKALEYVSNLKNLLFLATEEKVLSNEDYKDVLAQIQILEKKLKVFFKERPRILILSSIMGQGHMSAAKAIQEGLEAKYGKDYDIQIIDFIERIGKLFNKATFKVYESSTKYIPSVYKFFFESSDAKWQVRLLNILNYPLNASKLERMFEKINPSIIISTFPVWDYLVALTWKNEHPECKFISIVTDSISIHNCWVSGVYDYHIVANHDTAISLKKLGADDHKIKTLGFPVRLSFMEQGNRKEFLEKFSLNPKLFTIIFIPSAEKVNKASKTIQEIIAKVDDINFIVITGKNHELKPKLEKFIQHKNVRIIGWTNEMAEFIKNSDLVVTKAGGATVMECIAAKKPMIITQIIPGQEMGNAELIKKYQLGIVTESAQMSVLESIRFIRKNYPNFEKNLKKFSNPEASLKIAEFVHEQLQNNE